MLNYNELILQQLRKFNDMYEVISEICLVFTPFLGL